MIPYIIPITEARGRLGDLAEKTIGEKFIVFTKNGRPKTAMVDINYLKRLQEQVKSITQNTYIDPTLIPFTRKFTNEEIKEWEKEDRL